MYVIVVGAGRIGAHLIQLALRDGHDVGVFEVDRERASEIAKRFDVVVHNADATREENLEEADVDKADVLFATTRQDPVNLMVITLAERLRVPRRVTVMNDPAVEPLFRAKGAHAVGDPSHIAAEHLLHAARHPGVVNYVPVTGTVELFQVHVEPDSQMDGAVLREAGLPQGVIIAAVERYGEFVFPRGDTTTLPGDVVTLLAHEGRVDEALKKFRSEGARGGA